MSGYRGLFGVREFRYLYAGGTLSSVGDQLAAVAVAVLVYNRTGSALITAIGYASAWLPALLAGPLLGAYADRLPRRAMLIGCDLVRAVLVAALVIPGMPVWLAIVLLYGAHLCTPLFTAARGAVMPEVLEGDAYIAGNGLVNVTGQLSQIAGFAAGGVIVSLAGPAAVLAVNAATFAVSAAAIWRGLRYRAASARPAGSAPRPLLVRDSLAGARYVLSDAWLRGSLLLVWLAAAFAYAPEAIAYPFARELGRGAMAAGIMLAAPALGYAVGAIVLTRILRPAVRDRLLAPLAVLSTAALIPVIFGLPYWAVVAALFASGLGGSFSAPLNAIFVRRVPAAWRGRAMSVAITGLTAGQGAGFIAAGALGGTGLRLAAVTGLCGCAGTAAVLAAAVLWRRAVQGPAAAGSPAAPSPAPGRRSGPAGA